MRSSTVTSSPTGLGVTRSRVPSGHRFAATAPRRARWPFAIVPVRQYAVDSTTRPRPGSERDALVVVGVGRAGAVDRCGRGRDDAGADSRTTDHAVPMLLVAGGADVELDDVEVVATLELGATAATRSASCDAGAHAAPTRTSAARMRADTRSG